MDEIEKRAREIYAVVYERDLNPVVAQWLREGRNINGHSGYLAIRAIVAALSSAPQVPEDVMRDAERYRFLRGAGSRQWNSVPAPWIEGPGNKHIDSDWLTGDFADSAIDAAMLAAKPEL